jgi:hypothetical protein
MSIVTIEELHSFDLPCAPASGERSLWRWTMDENTLDALVRRYANRELCWRDLQEAGVESYLDVLGSLGRQGLRYPIAEMIGPNIEVRWRGIAMLSAALSALKPPENESLDEPGSDRGEVE